MPEHRGYEPPVDSSRRAKYLLGSILLLALALRLGGLLHDLPFSYYGDELHFMKRAMALGTGDLNPHWFHKPAFLMYVLLFFYGLYFLGGLLVGRFESIDHFAAHFLTDHGPFLLIGRVVVLLCGVAVVYVVYRIGLRLSSRLDVAVTGALMAAVTPALVSSSQQIKADVPCALLILLSLLWYIRDLEIEGSKRSRLVIAALLAGMAMGTKYYGIVLVPAYALWELGRTLRDGLAKRELFKRLGALALFFVLGFFVVSPYNFLDPTWSLEVGRKLSTAVGGTIPIFEIDARKEYLPGPAAWVGAGLDFLRRLVDHSGMGLPLAALFALGLLASLSKRRVHGLWTLIGLPTVIFLAVSVFFAPYHAQSRHLVAIMPLLCLFAWPAARSVAGILTFSDSRRRSLTIAMLLIVTSVNLGRSVAADLDLMKLDSRSVAYDWVVENIAPDERLLLEDDGPALLPNRLAIDRLEDKLHSSPQGPFVIQAGRQLELLDRFEPANGRNVDLLSRQWWLNQEKSDRQLANSLVDTDMGNPLVSRVPRPLEEYRDEGIRYVLTTSIGQRWLAAFEDPDVQFPSFVKFYEALARLGPTVTFDPAEWNGKGPIIWVHDLSRLGSGSSEEVPEP